MRKGGHDRQRERRKRHQERDLPRQPVPAFGDGDYLDEQRAHDDGRPPQSAVNSKGYLDSSAILELIVWYEQAYDFPLRQEDINIDNLGSINAMTDFLLARKTG